jgi:acetyl/propionyl-CoA carboxylase alpha subunit
MKKKKPGVPGKKPGKPTAGKTGMNRTKTGKPGMAKKRAGSGGKTKTKVQRQKTKQELLDEMKTENPEMYKIYMKKKRIVLIYIFSATFVVTAILCVIAWFIKTKLWH